MKHFNEYKQLNLAELSKEILEQWEKEDLFHKSIETREGCPSFLFFEGQYSLKKIYYQKSCFVY